jgi:hypothetical protein
VAVFESLITRSERAEDLGDDKSALWRTFDWVGARHELRGQFITALDRFPDQSIPPAAVMRLANLTKGSDVDPHAKQLIGRWANSENNTLATAAKAALRPAKA